MTKRLGGYLRMSFDRFDEREGVTRQRQDCQNVAHRKGAEITVWYEDNALSAYKKRVRRPGWERALEDLRAGVIDGLIAYDLDRVTRQNSQLEDLIDIVEERPGVIIATVQGEYDLTTSDGQLVCRMLVAAANKASKDTARRVARQELQRAQEGRIPKGDRPFGWTKGMAELVPAEADAIRTAAREVAAGKTVAAVVREWNAAGLLTSRGNTWKVSTLADMLQSVKLAGWRPYKDGIAVDADGQPVRGVWPPILTDAEHEAVRAVMDARRRPDTRSPRGSKYLLMGLLVCAGCGQKMTGRIDKRRGTHFYMCPAKEQGGCGSRTIAGPRTDAEVVRQVLARSEHAVAQVDEQWEGGEEVARLEAKVDELMAAYRADVLPADIVFPQVKDLRDRLAVLTAERRAWNAEHHGTARESDLRTVWDSLPIYEQRAEILRHVSQIVVTPPTAAGPAAWSPDRLHPVPARG